MDQVNRLLDVSLLTPIVRRVTGRPATSPVSWQLEPITYTAVSPHAGGVYRLTGTAVDEDSTWSWSLVLKVCVAGAGTAVVPATPPAWQREALAYQSGLLDGLPDGFVAPRCYGLTRRSDTAWWLWLEDIQGDGDPWPLERYGLAARQLGIFGGVFARPRVLPDAAWLSRHVLRASVADAAPLIELLRQPTAYDHPLLNDSGFAALRVEVLQLWSDRDDLCTRLEQLPTTLCHNDVWRQNLVARTNAAGQSQTVALDWELIGLGALGEDAGNLLGVSLLNLDVAANRAAELSALLLDSYVDGLRAAGWQGNERHVAYAYYVAAALRCVFSTAGWPAAIAQDPDRFIAQTEQQWHRPITSVLEQWSTATEFLLACARQARRVSAHM